MIPLLCISQQKYIIKGDTIVGYTLDENRSIALLFMKGEMYEELYFTQNEILAKKDSIINTQYYHIKFQDFRVQNSQTSILRFKPFYHVFE